MTVGRVDGPQAIQSAAEAQRLQRHAGETARGEEVSRRFAAELERARRQRQVGGTPSDAETGRIRADTPWERREGAGHQRGQRSRRDAPDPQDVTRGRNLNVSVGLEGSPGAAGGSDAEGPKGVHLDRRT